MATERRRRVRKIHRLRQLRRAHELTQTELGERVGLRKEAICAIECGRRDPSLTQAKAIAQIFRLPVEEVFEYVEVPA
jgi:putative transcriptional regulator